MGKTTTNLIREKISNRNQWINPDKNGQKQQSQGEKPNITKMPKCVLPI